MADVYIYKIINPKGKIYIGQTVNLKKRLLVYQRLLMPSQLKLYASVKKYGWGSHKVEVLSIVSNDRSNEEEISMIALYDSVNSGLNILPGGLIKRTKEINQRHSLVMKGRKKTDEFKAKMSVVMMGNSYAKGSVRTQEFKDNLSSYSKGRKKTNMPKYIRHLATPKKPVLSYSIDGVFIKEYSSLLDTERDGFDSTCIGKVCRGLYSKHKGVIFKFKDNG